MKLQLCFEIKPGEIRYRFSRRIINEISQNRLSFYGHMDRMNEDRLTKKDTHLLQK